MSQPKLAVGSVFSGLGHTTTGYDHFVYLDQADEKLFTRSTIVGRSSVKQEATPSHPEGLHALRDEFRDRGYERYLILDSDCSPVRENWMEILDAAMAQAQKRVCFAGAGRESASFSSSLYSLDRGCGLSGLCRAEGDQLPR